MSDTETVENIIETNSEGKISVARRKLTFKQEKALQKARDAKARKKAKSEEDFFLNPSYLITTIGLGLGSLGLYYYLKDPKKLQTSLPDYFKKVIEVPVEKIVEVEVIKEVIKEVPVEIIKEITKHKYIEVPAKPIVAPVLSLEEKKIKEFFN